MCGKFNKLFQYQDRANDEYLFQYQERDEQDGQEQDEVP